MMDANSLLNTPFASITFFGALVVALVILVREIRQLGRGETKISETVPNGNVTRMQLDSLLEHAKEAARVTQESRDYLRDIHHEQTRRNEVLEDLKTTLSKINNCPALREVK